MGYSDSDLVSIALTQTSLQPTSFSSSLASNTLTLFVLFLPIFLFQFNFSPNLVKWKSQFGAWRTVCVGVYLCVCVCALSQVQLFVTPWINCSPPLSMGFSRQEYWSGFPCPPPGDLPNPGIKPRYPAGEFFTVWATREAQALPPNQSFKPNKLGSLRPAAYPWFLHPVGPESCQFYVLDLYHPTPSY